MSLRQRNSRNNVDLATRIGLDDYELATIITANSLPIRQDHRHAEATICDLDQLDRHMKGESTTT